MPGIGDCVPARSARVAIVAAIRALNLPPGARIGVPLFCCSVVFKAIKAAGCTPCFIDVEPTTFCISASDLRAKRSEVEAVVAVHAFGNVCDIPALQDAVKGKPIIEDCAQALGSKANGRMAGSFGDVAAFSFRSGKYVSVGEGGAIFTSHLETRMRAAQFISSMPAPTRSAECVHAAKTYVRSVLRSKPLYGIAGYALWRRYNKKVQYSDRAPLVASQIYKGDLELARKRLPRLDFEIECQRANAEYYIRNLKVSADMLCQERSGAFYNRYQFPLAFPSQRERDFVADFLYRHQIDTSKPMKDVAEVATVHYGYTGNCPVAERLAGSVLLIPCYHRLTEGQIQRIVESVNQGWGQLLRMRS
jgi:dTDP-4-amino-4,6-dideoxygalactose transaminase